MTPLGTLKPNLGTLAWILTKLWATSGFDGRPNENDPLGHPQTKFGHPSLDIIININEVRPTTSGFDGPLLGHPETFFEQAN